MQNENINCWEFKKCGRESGGINVSEFGVCPVAIEHKLNGIHGGKNGGRCCWVFYGAFSCGIENPKEPDEQIAVCRKCNFYMMVKKTKELLVIL
jgi:hypothetical protein